MPAGFLATAVRHGTDWAAWVAAISTAATAVVLLVTAIFVLRGLGDARKTRHGELVTDLSRRWDEQLVIDATLLYSQYGPQGIIRLVDDLYKAPDGFTEKDWEKRRADLRTFATISALPTLIETIGVLHDEGVISTEVVFKMWGPIISTLWDSWREPIEHLRIHEARPGTYRYFEELAAEMKRCDVKEAAAVLGDRRAAGVATEGDKSGSQ